MRRESVLILFMFTTGLTGCIPLHRHPATRPATGPIVIGSPENEPVATQDMGTVTQVPGLEQKPKPFIAVPRGIVAAMARPSQLLLEHASPDSPLPLSDYGKQPVYSIEDFHLRKGLTASEVQRKMGPPAQLADTDDPWLVYRLPGDRELWLHFTTGPDSSGIIDLVLDAADAIRGAENGYVRDRVFSAD